jgi:hypothetical protein
MRRGLALLLLPLLAACTSTTNKSIRASYASYNQTIAYNQSQQMLLNLVRLRYRELPMFLKVGALSSSFSFELNAAAGIGRSFNETGVWDLGAGTKFSSRPTITYTPIEGNTFVKQLLAEVDQSTFVLLFRSGWPIKTLCHVLVERIAETYNNSSEPSYNRFLEIVEALDKAQDDNHLSFVTSDDQIFLQITNVETTAQGVPEDSASLERMIPFDTFQLRSLMDVMFFLAKNTEVPETHRNQVRPSDANGWLRIRSTATVPSDALVWVQHNGQVFSISAEDIRSKDTFALVKMLFEIQAGDIQSVTPILTLPVAQP